MKKENGLISYTWFLEKKWFKNTLITLAATILIASGMLVPAVLAGDTAKAITSFKILGNGTVNEQDKTIAVTVPFGTDMTALAPTIEITGVSVSPASGVKQDFSGPLMFNPVAYTVTAADNSTQKYSVTVIKAGDTAKAITSFKILGNGRVNERDKTIAVTVPFGTDMTALAPTIEISGAWVVPASNVKQDFTSPVTYTVHAADTTAIQPYVVTVTMAAKPMTNAIPWNDDFEQHVHGASLIYGVSGWYGSSANVIVQTNVACPGSTKAAMIPMDCILSTRFVSAAAANVWLQMDVRLCLYDAYNPTVNTNVAMMLFMNSDGNFVAHNGPTTNPGDSTNWVVLTKGGIGTNGTNWVKIGIYADFTQKKWDLYANGVLVTNNIRFINLAVTNFTGFDISNRANTTSYLDNVSVTVSNRTAETIKLNTTI